MTGTAMPSLLSQKIGSLLPLLLWLSLFSLGDGGPPQKSSGITLPDSVYFPRHHGVWGQMDNLRQ